MWDEYMVRVQELWSSHRDAMLAGGMLVLATLVYAVGWARSRFARGRPIPVPVVRVRDESKPAPLDALSSKTYGRLSASQASPQDMRDRGAELSTALGWYGDDKGLGIARYEAPHGEIFCVMRARGWTRDVMVCAPRPSTLPGELDLSGSMSVSWRGDESALVYNPSRSVPTEWLSSLYPVAGGAWAELSAWLTSQLEGGLLPAFELRIWGDHLIIQCNQICDDELGPQVELSVDLIERMIHLTEPMCWANDELERYDDLMLHLARYVSHEDPALAERLVADMVDARRVDVSTRDELELIARARSDEGDDVLLDALKRRWARRADDGLTLVDGGGVQGGLSISLPEPEEVP